MSLSPLQASSIDSLGGVGAEIMMKGAVAFIRSRNVKLDDAGLTRLVAALKAQGPKAVDEVMSDARRFAEVRTMDATLSALAAATFAQHGIEAAKAVIL